MLRNIPERDWKRLSKVKPLVLERFCQQILNDAVKVATAPTGTPHERYLKLYKFIGDQDDEIAAAFNNHRRSTALINIPHLRSHSLFTEEEFQGFSEETKEIIASLAAVPE